MGTSVQMIDQHYGQLLRGAEEDALSFLSPKVVPKWTQPRKPGDAQKPRQRRKPSSGLEPETPYTGRSPRQRFWLVSAP
jgi:hypothetical protein